MTRVTAPEPLRPRLQRRSRLPSLLPVGPGKFAVRFRAILAGGCVVGSLLHLGWPSLTESGPVIRWVQAGLLLAYALTLVIAERPRSRRIGMKWAKSMLTRPATVLVLGGLLF